MRTRAARLQNAQLQSKERERERAGNPDGADRRLALVLAGKRQVRCDRACTGTRPCRQRLTADQRPESALGKQRDVTPASPLAGCMRWLAAATR